jgi:hypothetical protein
MDASTRLGKGYLYPTLRSYVKVYVQDRVHYGGSKSNMYTQSQVNKQKEYALIYKHLNNAFKIFVQNETIKKVKN